MTVKELKKVLDIVPEDFEVIVADDDYNHYELNGLSDVWSDDKIVRLFF